MMKKYRSSSPSWLKTKNRLSSPDVSTTLIMTVMEGLFLPAVDVEGDVFCKRIAYPELRVILALAVNLYFEQYVPELSS